MHHVTEAALVAYVTALMLQDGATDLHVTYLVPTGRDMTPIYPGEMGKQVRPDWSQYPALSTPSLTKLRAVGIRYDKPTGWFRRAA